MNVIVHYILIVITAMIATAVSAKTLQVQVPESKYSVTTMEAASQAQVFLLVRGQAFVAREYHPIRHTAFFWGTKGPDGDLMTTIPNGPTDRLSTPGHWTLQGAERLPDAFGPYRNHPTDKRK